MGIFFDMDNLSSKNYLTEFEAPGYTPEEDEEEDYNADEDNTNATSNTRSAGDKGSGDTTSGDDGDSGDSTEGDTDGNEGGDGQENNDEPVNTDGGDDGEEDYTLDDDNAEGGDTEDSGEDDDAENDETNMDKGDDDEDYSLDGDDDNADGGDDAGDDSVEDTDGDDEGSGDDDTESNLKQLEGELFDKLTDEQKQIKIDELKTCFQEMHERCGNIIKLINDSTAPDEESSKILEYLNSNITDLQQYIYDYFTYTFSTKSYLENNAQYQKYIAILNSLNSILEVLVKKKRKDRGE